MAVIKRYDRTRRPLPLDARCREILTACLRRLDSGDFLDSVLADYPEDAGWLREHLIVAGALRIDSEPAVEKRSRARASVLYAVAHPEVRVVISKGVRPGLAAAYAVIIFAACLVLTAGVAAGSGVDVGSFAQDVVDKLVEPLPISAETLPVADGLEPGEEAAGDGAGNAAGQPDIAGSDAEGAPIAVDMLTQDEPPGLMIPPEGIGGASEPIGGGSDPPAGERPRDKNGDPDETPPPEGGPPDQSGGADHGQPGPGDGGSEGNGNHDGKAQSGKNESNGNPPNGGGSNGSNGGPSHDSGSGGPNQHGAQESNPSPGDTGGSR